MIGKIRTASLALTLAVAAIAASGLAGFSGAVAQEATQAQNNEVKEATQAQNSEVTEASESHIKAAKEALAASEATSQLDILLPNMGETAKQQLIDNRPDAADQLSAIVDEITISLAPRRGDLELEIARLYASIFTEEELLTIAEFYRTPAGRKLKAATPRIVNGMQQAARVWTAGIQRDLAEAIGKKVKEAGLQ
jgi:uncharacterized protein